MSLADELPKRYEPKEAEAKWQKTWANSKSYAFNPDSKKPVFSIDTPPPTVSGRLHIGHVFSYTHTEIIARYQRMKGSEVYYPFGYDDNGLPTELLTEKDNGIKSYQTERQKFRELCEATGKKYSQIFSELWNKLGFSCDFDSAYSTIAKESRAISQWSFVDLYNKGRIERRKEPALWCTKCTTSFAQAEIDDEHKAGLFVHIPFLVEGLDPLIIATTRPELLAACGAVFVNPDDERFKNYVGKKARVPFYNHEVLVLADPKALMDKGTGAVMCCTFGDTTDIAWWREHQLPLREAISKIGKMTEITGPLAGLKIEEAKAKMIDLLDSQNLILKKIPIATETRVVNVHERCGTPVEFLVQDQWFIKLTDIKKELITLGQKIKWHPEHMRYRYENWVENLAWDWAISRQRSFGIPIPAWVSSDGKHIHIASPEELPVDPTETQPKIPCPSGEWIGEKDVLDTWATSSVTPLINAKYKQPGERKDFLPMSMRPQAHDIIRTWAFYTIAKSYMHFGDMPWKHAVISGHVKKPGTEVEASQMAGQQFVKKTKISKRKDGDKYAPEKILEAHSADAIRLWSAGASLGTDILFDESGIEEANKFLNKLWNATRFVLMQLEGYDPSQKTNELNAEDLWVREEFSRVATYYQKSMDEYEVHGAKVELDKFFWLIFCDNYIEFAKARLLTATGSSKIATQSTLYEILLGLLKLYAPIAPHITEELYALCFKKFEKAESIHELLITTNTNSTTQLESGRLLVQVITAVRQYKSKNQLPFKVRADEVGVCSTAKKIESLKPYHDVIKNFASADRVTISVEKNTAAQATEDNETSVWFKVNEASLAEIKASRSS